KYLVNSIKGLLKKHQIEGVINQIGPVFHMMFIDEENVKSFSTFQKRDAKKYSRYAEMLLEEGILVRHSGLWYLSSKHYEKEVDITIKAIDKALSKLKAD